MLGAAAHKHDVNKGSSGARGAPTMGFLERTLGRPRPVLAVAAIALVATGVVATRLGAEFVPRLDEGELSLDIKRLPSISITEAQRLGVEVEEVLARFPESLSVVTRTGRAEVATDPGRPGRDRGHGEAAAEGRMEDGARPDGLGEAIKQAVEGEVPATFVSVSQPIEDRVNQLLAGSRADVVIKVFGQDLEVLKKTADDIGRVVRDIPGRGDWRVQRVLGLPLLEVKPDRQRLARYGMSADRVLEVVEASRVGRYAGKIFEGSRRFDLMLLLPRRR
jgi:cobalt-zinc-cadmium resistance protein CzcA